MLCREAALTGEIDSADADIGQFVDVRIHDVKLGASLRPSIMSSSDH